ncbi:hypothetical protein BDN72DRAFT_906236 [Pluteus cervinus]|uniref:Uncharacterized protein n=1 Tax=Pluteus cervinus TaxID=181527 RepID=A0ACD3A023_9AGAR|nr:hypothetical protein BDN72DRAFT_906236 [Pluteus cervinus]
MLQKHHLLKDKLLNASGSGVAHEFMDDVSKTPAQDEKTTPVQEERSMYHLEIQPIASIEEKLTLSKLSTSFFQFARASSALASNQQNFQNFTNRYPIPTVDHLEHAGTEDNDDDNIPGSPSIPTPPMSQTQQAIWPLIPAKRCPAEVPNCHDERVRRLGKENTRLRDSVAEIHLFLPLTMLHLV